MPLSFRVVCTSIYAAIDNHPPVKTASEPLPMVKMDLCKALHVLMYLSVTRHMHPGRWPAVGRGHSRMEEGWTALTVLTQDWDLGH